MARLLNSTLFNGDYNYAEPMGINAGIRNNQVNNNLYYNAKPYNISYDLTTDPIITTSFKPQIEPSINRDKVGIPSFYPYTDTKNSFDIIPSYNSPAKFTPKCLIKY
jgi:hypothetical protein